MKLHQLKSSSKRQSKKRLGRGPGSGLGKTSGRGHKGQKARSGGKVRLGFEGGQNPLFLRIPKFGFKNINQKNYTIVNLHQLDGCFSEGALVDKNALIKAKIIKKNTKLVKILGQGKLSQKLNFQVDAYSRSARQAIEKLGGKIEVS